MHMTNEIITAASGIVVAVIEAVSAMDRGKLKKEREQAARRAAVREKESRLSMQMMDATLELGLATAAAVEQGEVTSEMKEARKKAEKAQAEYERFVRDIAAHQVNKI